jgi:hypothetical protein
LSDQENSDPARSPDAALSRSDARSGPGRFRSDAEIEEAFHRLDASVTVTPPFLLRDRSAKWLSVALVLLVLAVLAFTLAWSGPRWSSFACSGILLVPLGGLLLSMGLAGRENVGIPLCRKCRHTLPPQAIPASCGECGASLRSPWAVVRNGHPVRRPAWIVAGVACLVVGVLSNTWSAFGLNRAFPNRTLISLLAARGGTGQDWNEVMRRSVEGRWSAEEIDEMAGVALALLDGSEPMPFQPQAFLEAEWLVGRLSPQRQQECFRLAYRLSLDRRGANLVLVASKRLHPRPSPGHFQHLAIGDVTVGGEPWRKVHRILGHDQIPYSAEAPGAAEIDLGPLPAGAPVTVRGFVLSSPFGGGYAAWEEDGSLLDLDPSVLAAPFTLELPR